MARCVSVVISTNGRPASLRSTLLSLTTLEYEPFEVVVVAGPDRAEFDEAVKPFAGQIKVVECDERNLSMPSANPDRRPHHRQ